MLAIYLQIHAQTHPDLNVKVTCGKMQEVGVL